MISKLAKALVLVLAAGQPGPLVIAETGNPNTPHLLDVAQELNAARLSRANAEIALQQALTESVEQLHREGVSSSTERKRAWGELAKLQSLQAGIFAHDRLLRQLARGCSLNDDLVVVPNSLSFSLTSVDGPDGTPLTWVIPNSQRTRSVLRKLAAQRQSANGRISAIEAEAEYLRARIDRLHAIDDGSPSIGREIQLSNDRLEIVESRRRMGQVLQRYQAECARLADPVNRSGFPIEIQGRSIRSPAQLMLEIDGHWWQQRQRIAAGGGPQVERITRLSPADATEDPLLDHFRREQSRCAQLRRNKFRQLRLLSDSEQSRTANLAEIEGIQLELAVLKAQVRELQEARQLRGLVVRLDANRDLRTRAVSTAKALDVVATILQTRSQFQGNTEVALAELRRIRWRVTRLASLYQTGYASWQELAIARRDAAIARSVIRATREESRVAKLELECIKRASDDIAENEDGPLAIVGRGSEKKPPHVR